MPRIRYIDKNFQGSSLELIDYADQICEEYMAEGYVLTLRQLYYQLVARGLIPNNIRSYKRLGNVVSDARLAGLLDWKALEDRTRKSERLALWNGPQDALDALADQYHIDLWQGQETYVEVWVEKEALAAVVERACDAIDVRYLACKGYVSQSEMWGAGQRIARARKPHTVIFHLGDHDPSGIDMTRDIRDRLGMFTRNHVRARDLEIRRIALNMDQIEELDPPPNPAKTTDSRFWEYRKLFGDESWELDALQPSYINDLIREHVMGVVNEGLFDEMKLREQRQQEALQAIGEQWDDVVDFLGIEAE